jgi:hypothetical protein
MNGLSHLARSTRVDSRPPQPVFGWEDLSRIGQSGFSRPQFISKVSQPVIPQWHPKAAKRVGKIEYGGRVGREQHHFSTVQELPL